VIVDTERDGWTRVGTLGWRKSLRDKHWAQIVKDPLGWAWTIHKVDPVTMCTLTVADGLDISLAAAKDDVDHWNDHYHRHAIVIHHHPTAALWSFECRVDGMGRTGFYGFDEAIEDALLRHAACEAVWQRGER